MARVIIVIEDALEGRWDGAVRTGVEFEPELEIDGEDLPATMARLTPAQIMGLSINQFIHMTSETLEEKYRTSEEPAE